MMKQRAKPFSAKQKKAQLLEKRAAERAKGAEDIDLDHDHDHKFLTTQNQTGTKILKSNKLIEDEEEEANNEIESQIHNDGEDQDIESIELPLTETKSHKRPTSISPTRKPRSQPTTSAEEDALLAYWTSENATAGRISDRNQTNAQDEDDYDEVEEDEEEKAKGHQYSKRHHQVQQKKGWHPWKKNKKGNGHGGGHGGQGEKYQIQKGDRNQQQQYQQQQKDSQQQSTKTGRKHKGEDEDENIEQETGDQQLKNKRDTSVSAARKKKEDGMEAHK
jgi:hypothetical protein